jgi:hypothetical protein
MCTHEFRVNTVDELRTTTLVFEVMPTTIMPELLNASSHPFELFDFETKQLNVSGNACGIVLRRTILAVVAHTQQNLF